MTGGSEAVKNIHLLKYCKTMKLNRIIVILLCSLVVSCNSSRRIAYMQNAVDMAVEEIAIYKGIAIQPKDILSIIVSSSRPELAVAFNQPLATTHVGGSSLPTHLSYRMLGYTVDMEGYIIFPFFGKLKVSGMTREQLSEMLRQRLMQEGLLFDATVTIDFMNFKISVLGEVRSPGTFHLSDDRITIFEAISRAGDLTMFGRRDNVLVRREQNGLVSYFRVDLRSTDIARSPAFYLQQNDVIYVEPNDTVALRSLDLSPSTLISLGSFLMSLTLVIINLLQ